MDSFTPRIIRRPGIKYTYLVIDPQGDLIIRANPRVSSEEIENLIRQKSEWIRKKRNEIRRKRAAEAGKLFYLGELFDQSLLSERFETPLRTSAQIDRFYRTRAKALIIPLIERWSEKTHLVPAAVSFRKNRTRWGSCSAKNRLSFNIQLAKTPPAFIEYIVVHELAHIRHKNHSRDFWNFVAAFLPDYREREALAKEAHYLL